MELACALAAFPAQGHGGIFAGYRRRAVRAPREWPTLATVRLSRRWGTQIWVELDVGHPPIVETEDLFVVLKASEVESERNGLSGQGAHDDQGE